MGIKKDILSEDCVADDVFNYSMNLLGAGFNVDEHLALRQVGNGKKRWRGKAEELLSEEEIEESYEVVEESFPIYYKVEAIDGLDIPYKRSFAKQSDFKNVNDRLIELGKQSAVKVWDPGKKEAQMVACTAVNHDPSLMNYWHVTLDAYTADNPDKPLDKSKSAWVNEIKGYIFDVLRHNYLAPQDLVEYSIPCGCYMV